MKTNSNASVKRIKNGFIFNNTDGMLQGVKIKGEAYLSMPFAETKVYKNIVTCEQISEKEFKFTFSKKIEKITKVILVMQNGYKVEEQEWNLGVNQNTLPGSWFLYR